MPAEGWGEVTYDILGRGNSTCKGRGWDITEGLGEQCSLAGVHTGMWYGTGLRGTARAREDLTRPESLDSILQTERGQPLMQSLTQPALMGTYCVPALRSQCKQSHQTRCLCETDPLY